MPVYSYILQVVELTIFTIWTLPHFLNQSCFSTLDLAFSIFDVGGMASTDVQTLYITITCLIFYHFVKLDL